MGGRLPKKVGLTRNLPPVASASASSKIGWDFAFPGAQGMGSFQEQLIAFAQTALSLTEFDLAAHHVGADETLTVLLAEIQQIHGGNFIGGGLQGPSKFPTALRIGESEEKIRTTTLLAGPVVSWVEERGGAR